MSTPTPPPSDQRPVGTWPDPQQYIAGLRASLLEGRGPGATKSELEAHQHQRVAYGGLPVTAARAQVALAADQARAIILDPAQERTARRLAQLPIEPPPHEQWTHRRHIAYALILGTLLGLTIGLRRARRAPR